MVTSSTSPQEADDFPLEELVFSCSVCQATVSDVYATTESNKGFQSGSGEDRDGVVTKLWIAECSHVTCSKHLEGGVVPLHPSDAQPRAPCPRCVQYSDDHSSKALYAIRGLNDGQCDEAIPAEWRQCPAIKLDASIPGLEAVQFQYMALAHYARRMRSQNENSAQQLRDMQLSLSKERKQRKQCQFETADLQQQVKRLEETESKLQMWEKRKPKIFHYLGVFGEMMTEIHAQRALLDKLGYQVTDKSYAFPGDDVAQAEQAHAQRKKATAPTANLSSGTTEVADDQGGPPSARKRKREHFETDDQEPVQNLRWSSRDMMPPPLPRAREPAHSQQPQAYWGAREEIILPRSSQPPQGSQLPFRPPRQVQPLPAVQRPAYQYDLNGAPGDTPALSKRGHTNAKYTAHAEYPHPRPVATPQAHAHIPREDFEIATADSRVSTYDDSRGLLLKQGLSQAGGRTMLNTADTYEQSHVASGLQYASSRQQQHHTAPVATHSPFFKARLGHMNQEALHQPSREGYGRARDGPSRALLPAFKPTDPGPTYSTRPAQASRGRSAYWAPGRKEQQNHSQYQQQHFALPQTPRGSRGFFQRPDRPSPSAISYATSQEQAIPARSRVLLPPNKGRAAASSYGYQDGALSRIQGVRGVASRQSQMPGLAPPPGFGVPRQLFSATGSRRSVRR